jgi:hypothetical protein
MVPSALHLAVSLVVCIGATACESGRVILAGGPVSDASIDPRPDNPVDPDIDVPFDPGSCTDPRPADCLDAAGRIWPVATDGGITCTDNHGDAWPSTGEGSAEWFDFIDCGNIKEFEAPPCAWVAVKSRGDICDGCVLWHINYVIEEWSGGGWVETLRINPEPDRRGMTDATCYQTPSGRFRIHALDGFYVQVYQR